MQLMYNVLNNSSQWNNKTVCIAYTVLLSENAVIRVTLTATTLVRNGAKKKLLLTTEEII